MFVLTRRQLLSLAAVPASIALAPAVCASPRSITEAGFVRVGGIEQWVAIRGRDRSRMPILFLHGGPCEVQSPFLSEFAPWEERYVVAQWDQRGAGRTFGRNGTSTPNMTLEQLAHDAVEVAQHVLSRLGTRELILVGHSWGAILGLSVIRLRPALFHAFVATGQPVNGREILESLLSSAIARAQAAGDAEAVTQLKGLSAFDRTDMTKLDIMFKWQTPFAGSDLTYLINRGPLGTPDKPANAAAADFYSSTPFCLPKLMAFVPGFDAGAAGYELPVPYFVIQGRDDNRTPPEAASAFVGQVHAPTKGYTAIEGGHFACFTNPAGFLDALDSDIRRLGIS
jgi:pimeloyl-ACP methyl ester carboxylesterase